MVALQGNGGEKCRTVLAGHIFPFYINRFDMFKSCYFSCKSFVAHSTKGFLGDWIDFDKLPYLFIG